jgi:hypothetical protein
MKHLKLFEAFEDIDSICKKFGITNYTINPDGTVDVDGDVDLYNKGLTKLPLKFGKVTGYFQNFIDGVYKITESLKMRLDWRSSRKEPIIYSESCRDFKAYNISLYFTIDKEYNYESEMEKTMKWARNIYGPEEFDKKFTNWAPK